MMCSLVAEMPDYRLTNQAAKDNGEILETSLANFGQVQVQRCAENLDATFRLLANNPLIARERQEHDPPVRIFPAQRHRIIQVIEAESVLIVRVLHNRMDLGRHI